MVLNIDARYVIPPASRGPRSWIVAAWLLAERRLVPALQLPPAGQSQSGVILEDAPPRLLGGLVDSYQRSTISTGRACTDL